MLAVTAVSAEGSWMESVGGSHQQTYFSLNYGRDEERVGRRKLIDIECIVFIMEFLEMFCLLFLLKKTQNKDLLQFKKLLKLVNLNKQDKLRKLIVNQTVLLAY